MGNANEAGRPLFDRADLWDVLSSTILIIVGLLAWFAAGHVLIGALILLGSVGFNLRIGLRHLRAMRGGG